MKDKTAKYKMQEQVELTTLFEDGRPVSRLIEELSEIVERNPEGVIRLEMEVDHSIASVYVGVVSYALETQEEILERLAAEERKEEESLIRLEKNLIHYQTQLENTRRMIAKKRGLSFEY